MLFQPICESFIWFRVFRVIRKHTTKINVWNFPHTNANRWTRHSIVSFIPTTIISRTQNMYSEAYVPPDPRYAAIRRSLNQPTLTVRYQFHPPYSVQSSSHHHKWSSYCMVCLHNYTSNKVYTVHLYKHSSPSSITPSNSTATNISSLLLLLLLWCCKLYFV